MITDRLKSDLIAGKYDVVSIDIFDTLLIRKGITASRQWKDLSMYYFTRRFFSEFLARLLARMQGNPEVTSEDIFRFMGSKFTYEREFEHEKINVVINPEILALITLLESQEIQYIFISDTHFKSSSLRDLIANLGVDNPVVFASSEFNLTKFTGLFNAVNSVLKLDPSRWLHIGDNLKSDVRGAREFGATALHYLPLRDEIVNYSLVSRAGYKMLFRKGRHGREVLCHLQLALAHFRCLGAQHQELTQLIGFAIVGPVGCFVADAVHKQSIKLGVDSVWFLSRDGWIPFNYYRRRYPKSPTEYVKVSRKMLKHKNFLSYLELLVDKKDKILVYDIGWRGSILRSFKSKISSLNWYGVFFILLRRRKHHEFILYKGTLINLITYWRSRDFLEVLFSEPSQSYIELDDNLIPKVDSNPQSNNLEAFHRDIARGVDLSVKIRFSDISESHVDLLLRTVLRYPSQQLRDIASCLIHDVDGGNDQLLILQQWDQLFSSRILWPQASGLRSESILFSRILFKIVLIFKEFNQRFRGLIRGRFQ